MNREKIHITKITQNPTNVQGIDPDEYSRRWGIETGYRMIENARVRTHSKSPEARMLYFVYSVMVFNAWVMTNAMMRIMTGITTTEDSSDHPAAPQGRDHARHIGL